MKYLQKPFLITIVINLSVLLLALDAKAQFPGQIIDVGENPSSVTSGDFNGDNLEDLAVANYGSHTVSILISNGDGVFMSKVDYAAGYAASSVTIGDFNGDNKLDLGVASFGSNKVSILLGNGDGTFMSKVDYVAGFYQTSVTTGDFNGDNKLDLAVANRGSGNISILLGNGDGTFLSNVDYTVGSDPYSVTTGDFNGDNKLDLAVANRGSGNISILLGNGDGTFLSNVDYTVGSDPYSVTTGDFNGDNKLDLAVANNGSNTVSILIGNGDGTFMSKVDYAAGYAPTSVTTGDFNGDNKLDLAVANYNSSTVSVLIGNGDGTFMSKVDYWAGYYPRSVTTGDFNGDNKSDLAVANSSSNTVSVLIGNGDGTFMSKVEYAAGSNPRSVTTGDFNGDNKVDLAVANYNSRTVSVLIGNEDGTFMSKVDYGTGIGPNSVTTGDFNGDNKSDLAVANEGSNTVSVLIGNGDGTFMSKVNYGTGYYPSSVTTGDFNGDNKSDLAVANYSSNTVSILIGNGEATFKCFIVNATNDFDDGICNDQHCSLREAINAANANVNTIADWIKFNIPGTGSYTIQPLSALPELTDPVIIDGTTQPGYSGTPVIELNGSEAEDWASGLSITAENSTVRGLVINGFGQGISLNVNGGNTIEGNFIGTDVSGTSKISNGQGIVIESPNNLIGGNSVGARNIISGNRFKGVWINGEQSNGNSIINNFIGVDVSGENGLGNAEYGVGVDWASNNTIAKNVISDNGGPGPTGEWPGIGIVENTATGNQIMGNLIGTTASGSGTLGNKWNGVWIGGAQNTCIGGTNPGEGNVISGNGYNGILISSESATGNRISGNSIYNNELLGIDLEPNPGVTPNDPGDLDNGPNLLQNYPLFNEATALANVIVEGYLGSTSNTEYTIEFFKNAVADISLHGEGKTFLGNTIVTTNYLGVANFEIELENAQAGDIITATATDPGNNTSEFSKGKIVSLPVFTATEVINPLTSSFFITNVPPSLSSVTFNSTWPGSDIEMTLKSPSGQVIDRATSLPNVTHELTATTEKYIITNPEAGEWDIELYGKDLDPGGETVSLIVAGEPKDPLNTVFIDIQPGDGTGTINCTDMQGVIPVAILTTEDFDATQIDHTTVYFGAYGSEAQEIHYKSNGQMKRHEEDVDEDGDIDLVFHFLFEETGIQCGDEYATLTGFTFDGKMVRGTDSIRTVGLNKNSLSEGDLIPTTYKLQQSFPNPFNPTTSIRYELPEQCFVKIEVFNSIGQLITVLKNELMQPGYHEILFNGKNISSGIYFYRIHAGSFIDTKKMILIK